MPSSVLMHRPDRWPVAVLVLIHRMLPIISYPRNSLPIKARLWSLMALVELGPRTKDVLKFQPGA